MGRSLLGLLGGTFDPVHYAHLRLAEEVRQAVGLAQVRFVPSARPPHRDRPGVRPEDRLRMVELAIRGNPHFVADDRELRRTTPSYTIDTVESLRAETGPGAPLCLIVGADAFRLFETWKRWRDLLDAVHVVVACRPGYRAEPDTPELSRCLAERRTDDAGALHASPGGRILPIDITALDISASAIRRDLAAGCSPRYLLPDSVLRYIESRDLYRNTDAG